MSTNGTLHLNWPRDDPKPARPQSRNGMSAMEEAFMRVGFRPAPRQQPQSAPPPDRAAAQRRTEAIKAEIAEAAAAFKAMSDEDLFAERLSIQASIDIIKVDLAEVVADGRDRSPGWQYRAERALAFIKARYTACIAEGEARKKQQRQQAHREFLVEQAQAKVEQAHAKVEQAHARQELDKPMRKRSSKQRK